MGETVRLRLGDALVAKGLLDDRKLEVALKEQSRAHRPLGEILVGLGFVRTEHIAELLAEELGIPFVRARDLSPDPVLVAALDHAFVRSTGAFPIAVQRGALEVAMIDPADPEKVSAVRERFPYSLSLVVITDGDLALLVRKHLAGAYGAVADVLNAEGGDGEQDGEFPVERVTQAILEDGVMRGATDIHVEPEEQVTRVRYRIDGVLQQGENLPRAHTDAIISRIKILSRLDIAERRRPQDGRLRITVDGRDVDMRISMMPCSHGENVVLRILDRAGGTLRLAQLGISADTRRLLGKICERPHGLFLVTGPTGSGKTTTLYSMLACVDAIHRNVATIEDPIEYAMPLIRQSQVEPSIGYGFHEGLRSLLRQDPDVILVGEIRDTETADMAIKASMTGHLVFSTLHTNSAMRAISRLVDLGIAPYLVEDSLVGVLAQRLVRRVCEGCGENVLPTEQELAWLGGEVKTLRRGTGCEHCLGTGLAGRTVITELFLPDDRIAELIREGAEVGRLAEIAREDGFRSMTEDGKDKVRLGFTTMDEVQRVNRTTRMSREEREAL